MTIAEKKMIAELNENGFMVRDAGAVFKRKKLSLKEVKIILKWIPDVLKEHLGTGDCLIRSLITSSEPYDPEPLINLFENSGYNAVIKWAIANTLSFSKTTDICKWLKSQLLNEDKRYERAALVNGLSGKGCFKNNTELLIFLRLIFDKYPMHVLRLYKKYAAKDDIEFLEIKSKEISEKDVLTEINKVIKKLNK